MVGKHWNRFLREAVDDPFLELLKVRLDGALRNLICLKVLLLISGCCTTQLLKVSSNPKYSTIL